MVRIAPCVTDVSWVLAQRILFIKKISLIVVFETPKKTYSQTVSYSEDFEVQMDSGQLSRGNSSVLREEVAIQYVILVGAVFRSVNTYEANVGP